MVATREAADHGGLLTDSWKNLGSNWLRPYNHSCFIISKHDVSQFLLTLFSFVREQQLCGERFLQIFKSPPVAQFHFLEYFFWMYSRLTIGLSDSSHPLLSFHKENQKNQEKIVQKFTSTFPSFPPSRLSLVPPPLLPTLLKELEIDLI